MKKIMAIIAILIIFMAATTFGAMKVSPLIDRWIPYKNTTEAYVSWYGEPFHGRTMANGRVYSMYNPSIAAHKTLPFGTKIRITNPNNGKSVIVRISDRGPYIPGREIDLSYGAAERLGIVKKGIEMVKIEIFTSEKFYFYRMKSKETLWRLFGHKWTKIARINNLNPKQVKKGTKIIVPYKL